jgi:hypothetical protein
VPYSFQPLSPRAIPAVAIIGTAKAGTTDLYTLLTRTSRMAPGGHSKRECPAAAHSAAMLASHHH